MQKNKVWSLQRIVNSEPNQNSMKDTRQLPSTASYRQSNKNSNPGRKKKKDARLHKNNGSSSWYQKAEYVPPIRWRLVELAVKSWRS